MLKFFRRLFSALRRYFIKLAYSIRHPKEPKRYDFKGMNQRHTCANCSLEYEGNFCPRCGQKAATSRLTPRNMLGGTLEVWDFNNKSILGTVIELFHRPGYFIRDYLKGHRAPYYAPIKLLFFLCVIIAIEVQTGLIKTRKNEVKKEIETQKPLTETQKDSLEWAWAYEDEENEEDEGGNAVSENITQAGIENQSDTTAEELTPEEEAIYQEIRKNKEQYKDFAVRTVDFVLKISDWVKGNQALFTIILNITFAFICWLMFRRAPGINGRLSYTEHFFIQIYISCQLLVIAIITLPFNSAANGSLSGWYLPIVMAWDFKQFFGISWIKSIWKTLLVLALNAVLIGLLFALATTVLVYIVSAKTNLI